MCVEASSREAIFAWERNGCIYYNYEEGGNPIQGRYLKFSYIIGGEKESICDRLYNEFQAILEHLYGLPLSDSRPVKKKI